ncbi:PD40 domain-containing protein [Solirubrobacter sp. CPCC 204708]|uniref:PD40 domain-containing protein n=1 Tax=Solirubrobacter deserti TaxID=2282478 RepID=A0ABT4RQN1_9ACTN|nr:PD40 domain-containing protein [Solirubrobacter deserti]MBE2319374.1 PD40 domain-containing protein [Solirubrobacter deserti]MDA0140872.1 PD40 domain-containing protein [Solirubrobacter deserti]
MRFARAAALVIVGAAVVPAYAQAGFPGRNGQLAVGGQVVNPDGTGLRPLVDGSRVRWSPDGMRIVYVPRTGGIAVAKGDGSDVRIISTSVVDRDPTWSPDGGRIAFSRQVFGGPPSTQVFTAAADGSDVRQVTQLTPGSSSPESRVMSDWSPDGATIAYTLLNLRGCGGLLGARTDGGPAPLPVDVVIPARAEDPDWAPDGSGVAYGRANCGPLPFGSSLIGPDRRVLVRLDKDDCGPIGPTCRWYYNTSPAVAPQGGVIAYSQAFTGGPGGTGSNVRMINVDGTGDRHLMDGTGPLDWRPLRQSAPAGACRAPGAIVGTGRDDVLVGTAGDDVICGGGGSDVMLGGDGDDLLVGGVGRDSIAGGPGLDRLCGDGGGDTLHGNAGDDVLAGGAARDLISGDDGADSLITDDDGGTRDDGTQVSRVDLLLRD